MIFFLIVAWPLVLHILILALPARAASRVDRPALLEAICYYETRGEPEPHRVVGDGGKSIGRCQVQIGTADFLLGGLFTADELRRYLHDPAVNAFLADWVLALCLARTPTVEQAIYCYNAGPRARWRRPTLYTKAVLLAYAEARRRAQWEEKP